MIFVMRKCAIQSRQAVIPLKLLNHNYPFFFFSQQASARNSRRKKQDYMEALEKRVKICTDEKRHLEKKVSALEKQNSSLLGQLKKLQKLVTEGTRQTARTGTCAMVRIYISTHFLSNLMCNLRIDILPILPWSF